jgi:putative Mn2+ efflux pump MntP
LIVESFFPALSLSLDAFAVAICVGLGVCETDANREAAFRMGITCGGFQFFMPFLGWFLGVYFLDYISSFDHWVAFALLSIVGGNMIRSSFLSAQTCDVANPARLSTLFYLALATSVDALAVGTSFSIVSKPVFCLSSRKL